MRVFLTGATGFVGSHIMLKLLADGHEVVGVTRSKAGEHSVLEAGAKPYHATLEDLTGLSAGAAEADAVIHTAFDHDFSRFAENCQKDGRVIEALGAALKGTNRPLMVTSGTMMGDAGDGLPAQELAFNQHHPNPRVATELAVAHLLDEGINARVMRLPQVHNTARQGLISPFVQIGLEARRVAYLGEGSNRWPAAHVQDVAALYARSFDKGPAGTRYHAVAEEGVSMLQIAEVVAARLDLPLVSLSPTEAEGHFGWFSAFVGLDMPASSAWTRAQLNWKPEGPNLLADLRAMVLVN